jgi:hypothetical protein
VPLIDVAGAVLNIVSVAVPDPGAQVKLKF